MNKVKARFQMDGHAYNWQKSYLEQPLNVLEAGNPISVFQAKGQNGEETMAETIPTKSPLLSKHRHIVIQVQRASE